MGAIEILLSVVFVLAAGTGFAVTYPAVTNGEVLFAKGCFLLASLALCAAYFVWLIEADRPQVMRIVLGIVVGVIALIGTAEALSWVRSKEQAQLRNEEVNLRGWLLPGTDPLPKTACTPDPNMQQGDWLFVTVAGGGVFTISKQKIVVLTIGDHPTIIMERGPSGLMLDVDMFNENGKRAVLIEQNDWRAIPGRFSYLKRPDPHTLVVYGENDREMLWVRYMNSKTVKIKGVFHKMGETMPIIISDDTISMSPNLHLDMWNFPNIPVVPCFVAADENFQGPVLTIR